MCVCVCVCVCVWCVYVYVCGVCGVSVCVYMCECGVCEESSGMKDHWSVGDWGYKHILMAAYVHVQTTCTCRTLATPMSECIGFRLFNLTCLYKATCKYVF